MCGKSLPDGTSDLTAAPDILVPDRSLLPAPSAPEAAETGLQRWINAAERGADTGLGAFARAAADDPLLGPLLAAIFGNSPFLGQCLVVEPDFVRTLVERGYDDALDAVFAEIEPTKLAGAGEEAVMTALRRARRRTALAVGIADVSGSWSVEKVTEALSRFADLAIEVAVAHLLRAGHDAGQIALADRATPTRDCGFIVLGMGKLGARELNYSSDIDLILLFDHDRVTYRGRHSAQEFFVGLARGMIRILEERTNDGYVFRTDLRLRPDPGSTPPVLSTLAAETYYESAGQNWERAAMIKARPVAGDIAAGEEFLDFLRPFIWRRSLDFDAIQDIQSIKRQINAHRGGAKIAIAGHNVKLGRGGIREIEFFAQTQQLIWGGRDATLRVAATCEALHRLADAGHIQRRAPEQLGEAYRFLRTVEHRLQMIDDQQTHDIPDTPERLARFAVFMGYADTDSFSEALSQRLHLVEEFYAGLFEDEADLAGPGTLVFTGGEDHPDTLSTLAGMGFRAPSAISSVIRAWHHGRFRATRSPRARGLLTELMPRLLDAFAKTPDPDVALMRFNDFLGGLPAGVQLFSLFHTNPHLLNLLAEIMGSTPRLAETLRHHPILFDAVLTADFFSVPPGPETLSRDFDAALEQARDFQDVLDILCREVNDRLFQIGVHILRGHLSPENAGVPLSNVADTAIAKLYPAVQSEFAARHGQFPDSDMAVVALGKLGGRELSIGSDLDLLLIYNRSVQERSDGERPLEPITYFTRLGQRFVGALSAPTGQGSLYEVDTRLRPSGNAGPFASSMAAFRQYHRDSAWTWEHMALTRARVVRAEPALKQEIDSAIREVLCAPRDADGLLRDVANMRARIERDRPGGGAWDVKGRRGGLVDVEFIAQYLQLRHAHEAPDVLSTNTTEALARLREAGFIGAGDAETLIAAMRLWRNLQGSMRLSFGEALDEDATTEAGRAMLATACGVADFDALKQRVGDVAAESHAIFAKLIEQPAASLPDAPSALT